MALNISDRLPVNKKRFSKYDPQNNFEGISFVKNKKINKLDQNEQNYEEIAGLNDLDSNILNKNPEKNLSADPLRIEMQLEKAEKKLKKINEELKINENLNINDPKSDKRLQDAKKRIENDILLYKKQYRELGITYKIADSINQVKHNIEKKLVFASNKIKQNTLIKKGLGLQPAFKEKQDLKNATVLNKSLSNELRKPGKPEHEKIEKLLIQAEKVKIIDK